MGIQHVVLLRFEPGLGAAAEQELFAHVRAWPGEIGDDIGGFQELRLGSPLSTERTQGYHYMLSMVVADADALAAYQAHPTHRRFVAWGASHGSSSLAFDIALDAGAVVVAGPVGGRATG